MKAYQHVLVPVDFSPVSSRLINRGKELAAQYHSRLTLLHVVQDLPLTAQAFGDVPSITIEPELQAKLIDDAQKQLAELAKQLNLNYEVALEIAEGLPYDSIMEYVDDHEVDLIITGHSAKKGLFGFMMGSTAESIVKHSKCDVFVMQAPNDV